MRQFYDLLFTTKIYIRKWKNKKMPLVVVKKPLPAFS